MLILAGPTGQSEHERAHHPERPARLSAAMAGVDDLLLGDELVVVPAPPAERSAVARVHTTAYLQQLAAFCEAGGGDVDPDTYATAGSFDAALRAAGAGLAVVDELRRRRQGVGFVAARPPGHHALAGRAMGFCLINNVAVTAAALTAAGERVLVIDWDVHHGNGTQAIFWDDPDVLYVSTHQWPLYPGTGAAQEVGGAGAPGATVNVPLPAGATGDVVRRAVEEVAGPTVAAFSPTWVLVSAGFDAHRDDPLADLALSGADFGDLALIAAGFAPGPGRLVLFLEGGYSLTGLRTSVATTLGALLGGSYQPEAPTSGGPGTEEVQRARGIRTAALELARRRPGAGEALP